MSDPEKNSRKSNAGILRKTWSAISDPNSLQASQYITKLPSKDKELRFHQELHLHLALQMWKSFFGETRRPLEVSKKEHNTTTQKICDIQIRFGKSFTGEVPQNRMRTGPNYPQRKTLVQ